MTGYQLSKDFNESYKYIWYANSSQIYNELCKMEQDGWLTSKRVIQDEKPNKRVYSITEKGRSELLSWLSTPATDVMSTITSKSAFLLRVLFAGYTSKESSLTLLHSFRDLYLSHKTTQSNIREAITQDELEYDKEIAMYWKIVALHGEIMNEARLKWVEQAIKIVENER